jgi:hypothetical protein
VRPVELNVDQRRETINTQQRFEALREAEQSARGYRGSMTWSQTKGRQYLLRSLYNDDQKRRQVSLGPRSAETEALKAAFESGRSKARAHLRSLKVVLERQASINRALRLGRMPIESARILRALDSKGLLGGKLKVLGSNALYAFEAASGVHLDAEYLETGDFDFLLNARARLALVGEPGPDETSLLNILQSVDRSFEKMAQTFRAVNRDGFMVDLVMPLRDPPWALNVGDRVGSDPDDLSAVEIEGLSWHENALAFEAIVTDAGGHPVRLVTTDPRVFAAHKLWLSRRDDRSPVKRARDAIQAKAVGALVARFMPHLRFVRNELRVLPKAVFDAAVPLFVSSDE